jgi:hypothetical protein
MMKSWLLIVSLLLTVSPARAESGVAELKYSPECILQAVAKEKHIALRNDVALPPIFVESKTPLKQFQDAIEPQWHLRPEAFSNAYIIARNEIYLIDEADYYARNDRFIDDSLAHELTHYLQVVYQHFDLGSGDESLEGDAIYVQTWFRDEFMRTGKAPCGQ